MSASNKIIQAAAGSGGVGISDPIVTTIDSHENDSSGNQTGYIAAVTFDSENNVYAVGRSGVDVSLWVMKLNADLDVQWSRYNSHPNINSESGNDAVVDSTDSNLFVVGIKSDSELDGTISKFNTSDGTTASQSSITFSQTNRFYTVDVDDSGNPLVGGTSQSRGIIRKYNASNLSDLVERKLDNEEGGNRNLFTLKYGSDGSIYVFMSDFRRATVLKLNSTYSIQWKYEYEEGTLDTGNLALDSSDNIYFTSHVQSTTKNVVMKLDPSDGSVTWQKTIDTGISEQQSNLDVNSDGEPLVRVGNFIFKMDTDGGEIWQRRLSGMGGYSTGGLIGRPRYDNDGNVVLVANGQGHGPCIMKLPTDGDWDGLMVSAGMLAASSATFATGTQARAVARGTWQSTTETYSTGQRNFTNSDHSSEQSSFSDNFEISPSIKLVASNLKRIQGTTASQSVAMPSGLQENDFVVVVHHSGSSQHNTTSVSNSWTRLFTTGASDTYDAILEVYYKKMGSTPDTEVVVNMDNTSSLDSQYWMVYAFRGVDTSTPFDVSTPARTTISNTVGVTPPSLTATTANALYLVMATAGHNDGIYRYVRWSGTRTTTLSYATSHDSYDLAGISGLKLHEGSAFTPSAIEPANFTDSTSYSGVGAILALRPA